MSPRKIRICRIQSRICIGGPAQQTILLSGRLDPDRFETILIGGSPEAGEEDLMPKAKELGVRTIRLPEMRRSIRPFDDLRAFRRLCQVFRRERPDIVHTHTAKAGALGRLAARACGVPIVVHTFHGHVLSGYFPPAVCLLFRVAERILARLTDRLVTLSPGQMRELSERHGIASAERFCIIPVGVDLRRYLRCRERRGNLRRELELDPGTRLIGWVGRMVPVKDPLLFLELCAGLCRQSAAPHIVLVGDGPLRPAVAARAGELGIQHRTHLLGYRRNMEEIYADLDLLVLTSRNEGTPVSLIEGMAAGLPVVAVDVGGVRDILRDYTPARLVAERTPAALAEAVASVLAQMPIRGDGSRIAARFSSERLIADIEQLYEVLLAQKGYPVPIADSVRREDAAA